MMIDVELKDKRWAVKQHGDPQIVDSLGKKLNTGSTLANLLVQRGITDFEEARKFFRPALTDLHDPFLMKDMDKAIVRMHQAIQSNEKIMVYGDYDVDGTTSVACMVRFLSRMAAPGQLDFYIPHRYREGYGVSRAGIDHASENGFSLIVSLDCGIKSAELIALAPRSLLAATLASLMSGAIVGLLTP